MTRATQHITILVAVLAVWIPLTFNLIPSPLPSLITDEILPVLPLWAIVSLGSYMLGSIGWHLVIFNEATDAQRSLEKEIETARSELRGRGVEVD